jgi:glycosyltransferase involved in cell wall biosynthesis
MTKKQRYVAIIPAYNEGKRIAPVVKQARNFVPVLVVDDGSTDGTGTIARRAGAGVIRRKPNQGKGAALREGFKFALAVGFQGMITLDGDGQHDPSEIPGFIEEHKMTRADLVIGRRDFNQMPPLRRFSNTLGAKAFSWALGADVPDNQSGYRLLSRRLVRSMVDGIEPGFEFELEMIVTCLHLGYRLESVPIQTIYAGESSHINNIQHLSRFLRFAWQTRRTRRERLLEQSQESRQQK